MDNKSAKFKQLQAKWYKKLASEGFEDIEQDEDNLKKWDSQHFIARHTNFVGASKGAKSLGDGNKFDATWFRSQEEYYQLAGVFLHQHSFENPKEKLIWQMHSEGKASAEIYRILKKRRMKVYRDGVLKIVKRLVEVMVSQCQPKKT